MNNFTQLDEQIDLDDALAPADLGLPRAGALARRCPNDGP